MNTLKYLSPKLFAVVLLFAVLTSCNRKVHKNIGLKEQQLMPCPDSPNCVVSQYSDDSKHYREPFKLLKSRQEALKILESIVEEEKRATLITQSEDYLHAEYKIPVMGFIDDLEFYFPTHKNVIHYRSASRIGYSDLGVNKRRIKKIEKRLIKLGVIQ